MSTKSEVGKKQPRQSLLLSCCGAAHDDDWSARRSERAGTSEKREKKTNESHCMAMRHCTPCVQSGVSELTRKAQVACVSARGRGGFRHDVSS